MSDALTYRAPLPLDWKLETKDAKEEMLNSSLQGALYKRVRARVCPCAPYLLENLDALGAGLCTGRRRDLTFPNIRHGAHHGTGGREAVGVAHVAAHHQAKDEAARNLLLAAASPHGQHGRVP